MKRITPEEVVAAYAVTGLKPEAGHVGVSGDRKCCALGALYYAKHGTSAERTSIAIHDLGLDHAYGQDFAEGFDCELSGVPPPIPWAGMGVQGIEDGVAAAKAVKP